MKKIIPFLIFTFTLLIISNVESKGQPFISITPSYIPCNDMNIANQNPNQEPNCDNIGCDNPNAMWQYETKFISLPEWPNCFFQVHYCKRVCNVPPNPQSVQVKVFFVSQAVQPCVDCTNFNSWLMSDPLTNGQLWFLRSWEQVTLQLYQEFVDDLEDLNQIDLAYCPNLKSDYTATKSSCKSLCFYQHYDQESQSHLTVLEEVECNQGSCCVYKRNYCVDPMTHEVVIEGTSFEEEILQEVGPCDSQYQPQFSPECYNGFNMVIKPCHNKCVEPE